MITISLSRKAKVELTLNGEAHEIPVDYTPVTAKNIIAIRSRMAEAGDDENEQVPVAVEFLAQVVTRVGVQFTDADGAAIDYPPTYDARYEYWHDLVPLEFCMTVFGAIANPQTPTGDEGK